MPSTYEGPLDRAQDSAAEKSKYEESSRSYSWALNIVRPAFLQRISPLVIKEKTIRKTSWLDGLRGFAAFMVYWHHNQLWAHDANGFLGSVIFENSYGYKGNYYLVTLPFLRTFFVAGHFAVTVFFVISGYVLSTKALSQIHSGEYLKSSATISSALFRRWLRLYIPVFGSTFIYLSIMHITGIKSARPLPKEGYFPEIWNWLKAFFNYAEVPGSLLSIYVFCDWYNFYLWSIPIEFKGSLLVYLVLAMVSRVRDEIRLWCEVGLLFYFSFIVVDAWSSAMFMGGLLLADLDLLADSDSPALPDVFKSLKPYETVIFTTTFIISLYLGGVPSHDNNGLVLRASPGWHYLSYLFPYSTTDYKWFYLIWAAIFLVASVRHLPWLRRFFEGQLCQYLARVSYALYLVHGPVLWTLGDRVYAAVGWVREKNMELYPGWANIFPLPNVGPMGLEPRFWIPHIILLPFTLLMAEIVTVLFDEPAVKIANWVYQSVLPKQNSRA